MSSSLASTAIDRVTQTQSIAPLTFIENVGQFDSSARFQVRSGGATIWLAEDAIWVTVIDPTAPAPTSATGTSPPNRSALPAGPRSGTNLKLTFPGANPHPRLEPVTTQTSHVSYFVGRDAAQWHADVPVWGSVRYHDLYPGLDLEIGGDRGQWSWRLTASSPHPASATDIASSLARVRLQVEGSTAVTLQGDVLKLGASTGAVSLPLLGSSGALLPSATIVPSGNAISVVAPFGGQASPGARSIGLAPVPASGLVYSTYLGGSGSDYGNSIAVDATGNAYVTGFTYSPDFPTTPGAFQTSLNGNYDVFTTKLNPSGTALIYSTYLGGSSSDYGNSIAVDATGNAYLTGQTSSVAFPITAGAFQSTATGQGDAFITKLNPSGTALIYSTYLGGSGSDYGNSIAVDARGNAYVTGFTYSPNFPTTPGAFQASLNGNLHAFITKLNPSGTALVYSTYLGGSGQDTSSGIAVDGVGNAYVTGQTFSVDFPTSPGAFQASLNGSYYHAFVTKLNPSGTALVYSTYLGGSSQDTASGIAIDRVGNAYVTGQTFSVDFPTTPGAFQTSLNGFEDAVITKLNPSGNALDYSTYLGGSGVDLGMSIAIDGGNNAYVTGHTDSTDFPTSPGAFQTTLAGNGNAFISKINLSPTQGRSLHPVAYLPITTNWSTGGGW